MTLRYLLDTSIVSSPMSKIPDPDIVKRLDEQGHECAIAAPVVRASFPILPYDDAAATWHGHERARLEALGRPVPYVDGQIAAIAHASQLVVVTINTSDFSRFTGLKVENWSKRRTRP